MFVFTLASLWLQGGVVMIWCPKSASHLFFCGGYVMLVDMLCWCSFDMDFR